MKKTIPTYDLSDISQHGIVIEKVENRIMDFNDNLFDKGIHRDSHYIFMFLETGHAKMMVDFSVIEAKGAAIFCLMPGQVHQGLLMDEVSGWFLGIKTDLLPDSVRSVFEESLAEIKPLSIDAGWVEKLNTCAGVLHASYTDEMIAAKEGFSVVQSLVNAYTGMFAYNFLHQCRPEILKESRALQLTRQFRILIRKEFKTLKSPSLYASMLNISSGYLTEVIHEATGRSALYWIQQEILVEAKRLLFFTHLSIKEIAHELGYQDHAYFTRLFSKLEGRPPSGFRDKSRKSS
ncbi:AraC family transcriptional activator of pobA [Chryseobacterium sp. H1D6B]|uniref:helix-turn-helix domain-containing protein n=1 Tax=Chryseobacterium sp. H1D6B TaxID=2940588 RepID=UPI0015C963E8|nr:AraC family transcriptional regulator [Chryseobacterium sp. H1D6B]MDH6250317.1 AraC family transcriptional activator of pobA [Chryseobacterium sp. H1D6B]